jgi:hypothetical protein
MKTTYIPRPIDTSETALPDDLTAITELLAKNTHEIWAQQRFAEGWHTGAERNDERKEHPSLVPYEELSESEKEYDRKTAMETIRLVTYYGYEIKRVNKPEQTCYIADNTEYAIVMDSGLEQISLPTGRSTNG